MWTSPRYRELTGRAAPEVTAVADAPARDAPAESGERLATFPRNHGTEELRITLCEYNGHPYVAVRLWALDSKSGEWWPTRKGTSIRMAEVQGFADALLSVAGDQPRQSRQSRQSRPGPAPASRPVRSAVPSPERSGDDPGASDGYVPPRRLRPQPRPLGPPPAASKSPPWVAGDGLPLGGRAPDETPFDEFNEFANERGSES
jgi:hypothetical protein